eukprot:m.100220 g.100220  ORF g.100220 m.100220 type:complete len:247 (+) comp13162_c0_seq1:601-1341(+)
MVKQHHSLFVCVVRFAFFSLPLLDAFCSAQVHWLCVAVEQLKVQLPSSVHATTFEVETKPPRFMEAKEQYGSFIAYHGTPVENLYSILNNGFCGSFSRTQLFGPGTYCSTDLSVCTNFAPTLVLPWQRQLGQRISCICVCEIVNHPEVKKPGQVAMETASQTMPSAIPKHYIIVPNDDHIRLSAVILLGDPPARRAKKHPVVRLLHTHGRRLALLCALIVLLYVAWSLPAVRRWRWRLRNKEWYMY